MTGAVGPSAEAWSLLLADGRMIAIGGAGLNRKPMGLIRSLTQAAVRDLVVVSYLGSLDVELLLAAGVVSEIHTCGVGLDGMGLAPRYRTARQTGEARVVEWSEGTLAAALEAGARAFGSMPTSTAPGSEIVEINPYLAVTSDPFTAEPMVVARALTPDVGLMQGSAVDSLGNVHIDGDPAIEGMIARAASTTIASVLAEEDRDPRAAAVSRIWIDQVFVDPDGAWPTQCHPGPPVDLGAVGRWQSKGGETPELLDARTAS